jgi:hypothetical protein
MIGKLDGHRLVLSESDFDEFLVVCVTLSDWSPLVIDRNTLQPGFTRWLCNFAADSPRFCYNRQVIYADSVAQN